MMMLEFSFPPPKKDCLTVSGVTGASGPLALAEVYVHVIFKGKVLNHSIYYLPLLECQTVPVLCSFFKVSFHSSTGGA